MNISDSSRIFRQNLTLSWAYLNGVAIHMPWMILLEDPRGLGSGFQSWIPKEFGFKYIYILYIYIYLEVS